MLQLARATRRLLFAAHAGARSLSTTQLSTLVVAEHSADSVKATLPAVTAAAKLGHVRVLVAGAAESPAVLAEARRIVGVSAVFYARHPAFEHGLPEPLAALLVHLLRGPWTAAHASHVLAASSVHSRAFLPRAAAVLGAPMLDSVTAVEGPATFQRPVYAGNAVSTVELTGSGPRFLTVRSTAFPPAEVGAAPGADVVRVPDDVIEHALRTIPPGRASRWVSDDRSADTGSARPDLSTAKVVVSGGRGMQSERGLGLVNQLADRLGGAVGASRAVVDAGLAPNELQVGQTGKVVAPELYVAVGISGAIQHVAGMKDSKTIVAINKDPEAPIFKVADIGLVADGAAAVEELLQKLPSSAPPSSSAASSSGPRQDRPSSATSEPSPPDGGPTGDLSFTRASDLVQSRPSATSKPPHGGPTGDLSFTRASDLVQ